MSNPNPKSEYDEAMEQYEKDIEKKIKQIALKDFKIKLLNASINGYIIPDNVMEMIDQEINLWKTI